jgi:hypothetical protein
MKIELEIKKVTPNNRETTGRVMIIKRYKLDWKTRWKLFWTREISLAHLANNDLVIILQRNRKKTIL